MTQPLIKLTVGLVTLICWGMTLYKVRDLVRNPHNRPLRALWITLMTITLSLTVQPIAPLLDRLVGLVDFGRVLSNCLTLIACAAAQAFLLYMSDQTPHTSRRVYIQYGLMAAAVTTVVLLFALDPPPYQIDDPLVRSGSFYTNGTPPSGTALYTYVYLAYVGWSMVQSVRLSVRYARIASRPLLRGGLRLITAGSLVALVYVILKLVSAAVGRGGSSSSAIDRALIVCFTMAILLFLIGSTVPSWGPILRLDKVVEQTAAWRACRQLHPLWELMVEAAPRITLLSEPEGIVERIAALRSSTWRQARMAVETLDGYAIVRPWMSQAVADTARAEATRRGQSDVDLDAAVEAALLVSATRAYRRDDPRPDDSGPVSVRALQPLGTAEARTSEEAPPSEEIGWLARVAKALPSAARHVPAHNPTAPATPAPGPR